MDEFGGMVVGIDTSSPNGELILVGILSHTGNLMVKITPARARHHASALLLAADEVERHRAARAEKEQGNG